MLEKIKGIIPPIITPLTDEEGIDEEGLRAVVNFLTKNGASGIFVLGTTGEGPYLSINKRIQVTKIVKEQIKPEFFLLMGVSDLTLRNSLNLVEEGLKLGVDGFVSTFPQYFDLESNEIKQILTQIHRKAENKPVFAYDVSSSVRSTASLTPKLILELANENIIQGVKYTGSDWDNYAMKVLTGLDDRKRFRFLAGAEILTRKIHEEGVQFDGGIFSAANLFPRLYNDFYNALENNDDSLVSKIINHIFSAGGISGKVSVGSGPALIKEILIKLGLPISSRVHAPLPPVKERIFKKIDKLLETIDSAGYLDKYE